MHKIKLLLILITVACVVIGVAACGNVQTTMSTTKPTSSSAVTTSTTATTTMETQETTSSEIPATTTEIAILTTTAITAKPATAAAAITVTYATTTKTTAAKTVTTTKATTSKPFVPTMRPGGCVITQRPLTIEEQEQLLRIRLRKPTLADNFKDDIIIVTIRTKYNLSTREWYPEDFPGVDVAWIDNTTPGIITTEAVGTTRRVTTTTSNSATLNNAILYIHLNVSGKQQVLDIIELLHKLDWVLTAEPQYL